MIGVIDRPPARSRTIGVALLGCGVVGSRVAQMLVHESLNIAQRTGSELCLKRVLVRNAVRDRGINRRLITNRFDDLLEEDIDIAIEVMGGVDPAVHHVRELLERGIHVVSANKTLIAHHGHELTALADENGVSLSYEASVCAAIPVLASLRRLRGDRIRSITGIVNGACNYILTRMSQDDLGLPAAVEEAARLGLVEPDPSADLSGRDSAEKLCILSAIAGFGRLAPSDIATCGIEHLTREDILFAKRLGCAIKLIASINEADGGMAASICPAFVHKSHCLASVQLEDNALSINSELGGDLLLHGKGAGPRPTASALLGDVLECAISDRTSVSVVDRPDTFNSQSPHQVETHGNFYFRIAPDGNHQRPELVLARLQRHGISVAEIEFRKQAVRCLTNHATLSQIRAAANAIGGEGKPDHFIAHRLHDSV